MSHYLRPQDYLVTPEGPLLVTSAGYGDTHAELLNQQNGASTRVTIATLRQNLSDGIWHRASRDSVTGKISNLTTSPRALARERYNFEVVRRLKAEVKAGKTVSEAFRMHAGDTIDVGDGKERKMCSKRQAQRLFKVSESRPLDLTPAYSNRGNHGARYPEELKDLVLELVDKQYAKKKSRLSIRTLTDAVNVRARDAGLLGADQSVSRGYVKKVVVDYWHPDLDYRRLDPRVAHSAKAIATTRIRPGAPLQRVEQDTLSLPFIVQGRLGRIETLNLMLAIDCETSMPLAWLLLPRAPTVDDTLQCMEIGMYSKRDEFKRLDINCNIDPFGVYLQIHLDNGPENRGARVDKACVLGTDVTRTPVYSGHRKPFIERLNGSLKRGLQTLPGCTRFNGKDGKRSEEAGNDPLMTFEELERWIVRWLYEKWINQPLERFITADYELDKDLGLTPADRWLNSVSHFPIPLPPPRHKWLDVRYLDATRSLSAKTGISYEGFDFRGANLATLITQYGPNASVAIKYNPSDYRYIYVADKFTGEPLKLINDEVSRTTPAYSFEDAKMRRKATRATHKVPEVSRNFDRDMVYSSSRESKPSRHEERRKVTRATKTQDAVDRARTDPIPLEDSVRSVPVAEVFVTLDAIPSFAVGTKASHIHKSEN